MKKKSLSSINKQKWKDLSELMREVRKEKGCEVCGKKEHMQVHHVISKFYKKSLLRYNPSNLVCLCPKHHFEFHKNPIGTIEWFSRVRRIDYQTILDTIGRINE